MSTREVYFKSIEDKLLLLVHSIKVNGKLNLLDGHLFAEAFFAQFLNILYQYHLHGTNRTKPNYAAIDLVDEVAQIVIQVTSQITREKIQKTLLKSNLVGIRDYRLRFVLITEDAGRLEKHPYQNPSEIHFSEKTDIIDVTRLLADCRDADIETLLQLKNLCDQEFGSSEPPRYETSLLVEVVKLVAKIQVSPATGIKIPNSFDIQEKIDFNELKPIQNNTISLLQLYSPELDRIYELFALEGTSPAIVFQKLVSVYQNQRIRNPDKRSVVVFLDMVDDLMTYIDKSANMDFSLTMEQKEYFCRVILVDAFIRCKIFENPEGYQYDTTN